MNSPRLVNFLALRADLKDAVKQQMDLKGPDHFDPGDIVRQFAGRIGSPTILRWVNEDRARLIAPPQRNKDDSTTASDVQVADLPRVAQDGAQKLSPGTGSGIVAGVFEQLILCVWNAQQNLAEVQGGLFDSRDIKKKIAANDHLRKCLETAGRVKSIILSDQVEALHKEVIAEINKESPECAERILKALTIMMEKWPEKKPQRSQKW